MRDMLILVVVLVAVVVVVTFVELIVATVPMLIVITMVPPHEREVLATVLASVDSSPRLRLWPALRLAAAARRARRRATG
jgi:hypothetical protein